jgi:hypothetical protein
MTIGSPIIRALVIAQAALLLTSCGGGGGGGDSATTPAAPTANWSIPVSQVVDGGPGKDGIPSIDAPVFELTSANTDTRASMLVVGIRYNGETKAYSHDILNYHEVVNDGLAGAPFTLHYCPLTGSAMAWEGDPSASDPTFGVSGLLYESNLILYDRESESNWAQMLEESVEGSRIGDVPNRIQVIETTMNTWRSMYPDSQFLTRNTGHVREYSISPYGNYNTHDLLLFPVTSTDNRLHIKERIIGIRSDTDSKAFQIEGFGATTQAINDQFNNQPIVAVGNSSANIAAIYSRELSDGTILTFSPLDGQLPNIMQDNEGNVWDVFGTAVSGARSGTVLAKTNSYTAMWFAWTSFNGTTALHFN